MTLFREFFIQNKAYIQQPMLTFNVGLHYLDYQDKIPISLENNANSTKRIASKV